VNSGQTARLTKFGGYTVSRYHAKENLVTAANEALDKASGLVLQDFLIFKSQHGLKSGSVQTLRLKETSKHSKVFVIISFI